MARHSWPGNVRELENVLGNACMMAEGDTVDVRDLPECLRAPASPKMPDEEELVPMAELERR